jgi:RHS repeat-associated protein
MPGRKFNNGNYRYGFNGKEKDDEIKGSGNSYDFGARLYDPRLGRWLSTDPLAAKYPDLSPYNFVANSPLIYIDPDGKRIVDANGKVIAEIKEGKVEFAKGIDARTQTLLTKVISTDIGNEVVKNAITAAHDIKLIVKQTKAVSNDKGQVKEVDASQEVEGYTNTRAGVTSSNENDEKTEFKDSKVTIYEGSVEYLKKNPSKGKNGAFAKMTQVEGAGAVIVHELTHATDKNSNGEINRAGTHENNPQSNEDCYIKEISESKAKSKTDG